MGSIALPFCIKSIQENDELLKKHVKEHFHFYENTLEISQKSYIGTVKFFKEFQGSLYDSLKERIRLLNERSDFECRCMHYDVYIIKDGKFYDILLDDTGVIKIISLS
jgi:hypothetical protein